MTQSSPLLSLAERCENEAAGSRELDVLIRAEIDNRDVIWNGNLMLGRHRNPPHDECRLGSIDPGKLSRNFSIAWSVPECPYYTTSLDAALTLVPEAHVLVSLKNGDIDHKYYDVREHTRASAMIARLGFVLREPSDALKIPTAKGSTFPLALSAAALRALAATE